MEQARQFFRRLLGRDEDPPSCGQEKENRAWFYVKENEAHQFPWKNTFARRYQLTREFGEQGLGPVVRSKLCRCPDGMLRFATDRYPADWRALVDRDAVTPALRTAALTKLGELEKAGFVHGDMHPGNLVADPVTNAVAWIDLEYTYRASEVTPRRLDWMREWYSLPSNASPQDIQREDARLARRFIFAKSSKQAAQVRHRL